MFELSIEDRKFAIYVLGAGFSKEAGLPLAPDLWKELLRRALPMGGRASKFKEDLDDFIEFKARCDGKTLTYETADFEEFVAFLDIEHHLGLRGGETWSDQGNEGQIVTKTLIAQIITELTPPLAQVPELYIEFARRLQPGDVVLTFNYDILLERALEKAGVRFRLFPDRFEQVRAHSAILDANIEEVIVLKAHGSVDWFDKLPFIERIEDAKRSEIKGYVPSDAVFNPSDSKKTLTRIVDGPRLDDDPLRETYRLTEIEEFYRHPPWFLSVPSLIAPSRAKLVYTPKVGDFWRGWRYQGTGNFRIVIIGYSLPEHDDYARQAIYRLIDNYQTIPVETVTSRSISRDPILIVDLQPDDEGAAKFKSRYAFVDWDKAIFLADGFSSKVLQYI